MCVCLQYESETIGKIIMDHNIIDKLIIFRRILFFEHLILNVNCQKYCVNNHFMQGV